MNAVYLQLAVSLIACKLIFNIIMAARCKSYPSYLFWNDLVFMAALILMIYLHTLENKTTTALIRYTF